MRHLGVVVVGVRSVDRWVVNNRRDAPLRGTDLPTVAVVALFWVSIMSVVLLRRHLPTAGVIAGLAVLGGLYMSLQHEIIHGHPTPSRRLNWLLVSAPLGMTQPFDRYRDTHLAHHEADLTNPVDDPESYYVTPAAWGSAGGAQRLLLRANRTLAGRLTVGPFLSLVRMVRSDLRIVRGRRDVWRAWLLHVVAVGLLIVALRAVAMPVWIYLVGFVLGGASFTSLRSFVEHRAADGAPRSAVVRSGWFFSLIFLNNNLHYTHHRLPGASWFRLPELTRSIDAEAVVADGAGCYRGYHEVARRFLFRPFDQPVYPLSATIDA